MLKFFRREFEDYKVLLRNVPALAMTLFVVSIVAMNLLANKELFCLPWVACDCGLAFSWLSFLTMDCLCKRFGGKASTKIAILAIAINLVICGFFSLLALVPGHWGEYYSTNSLQVDEALNATIGGSWYVVLGSAFAMLCSAIVNSVVNIGIARNLKKDNFSSFATRSFISTWVAQVTDNLVFALVVMVPLFGWTLMQVIFNSLIVAVLELGMEVAFSGFGYKISKKWQAEHVGEEYINYIRR